MAREDGAKPGCGIGPLIKRYRESLGLTQHELSAAAGISVGALRDLEQGRTRSPRWETVEDLAAALGLGPAQRAELARAFRAAPRRAARRREPSAPHPRGVRIDILGPLTASRDGQPLALGSARQRAVLGLLALHADSAVHRDAIIDMLWGQRPPASALPEVQGYISRLRKTLGDEPTRSGDAKLVTTAGGCCYRLDAGPAQLDLAAFAELTRQARDAAGLDPASACDRYDQALALWQGNILTDVDLLRGHPATVEASRRRAEAILGYAQAATEARTAARVLPHLRDLCAREPLNEPAHAHLMTALAATGQQAAALQVFTDLRHRLNNELGISPSPVLAAAHTQILRQRTGSLSDE